VATSPSDPGGPHPAAAGPFDEAGADYWGDVYDAQDLQGDVYRARHAAVLAQVERLRLAPGAPVLEVGCGAGRLSVDLAREGLEVTACDASQAMLDRTAARTQRAGLTDRVTLSRARVESLPFEAERFSAIVAVGVLPWVDAPGPAIAEMARVLRPGGHLVVTADNRSRLGMWVDPRLNPRLARLRRGLKAMLGRGDVHSSLESRLDSPREIDRRLEEAGLEPMTAATVGFGPFSLLGIPVAERPGRRLNRTLQRLADRGTAIVRGGGWHYLVVARRRARSPEPSSHGSG
jgi:SAM-dependent methyltransferase